MLRVCGGALQSSDGVGSFSGARRHSPDPSLAPTVAFATRSKNPSPPPHLPSPCRDAARTQSEQLEKALKALSTPGRRRPVVRRSLGAVATGRIPGRWLCRGVHQRRQILGASGECPPPPGICWADSGSCVVAALLDIGINGHGKPYPAAGSG